ncbi:hypothetical protein B0O99DRAFT_685521 [Bisporella sp. PMI_857]|nr:hypothetical protein B0O99DRAFT_685521 [Bisporella sp. PMI_857]
MATSSYEAFMSKKLAEKFPPRKNETDALLALFGESINAAAAATQYTSDIISTQMEKDIQAKLWRIWILLQNTAAQFPEQHEKIDILSNLNMVAAISSLPDHIVNGKVLVRWSDLPVFSSQRREGLFNWDESHMLTQRINLTAFTAKLSTHSLDGAPSFTASETDFWIAFEQTTDDTNKLDVAKRELHLLKYYCALYIVTLDKAAIQQFEANVPVAAQWILFAGMEIYNCEEVTLGWSGGLWKEAPGFSKTRWNFWKERARWVSEQQKLSKATREVAEKLLEKTDEVEMAAHS